MSRLTEWLPAKPAVRAALEIGSAKVACVIARDVGDDWQIAGAGVARYPSTATAWPCEIAVMARTIEQAIEAAGCGEMPDEALAVVSHPQLLHTRITAQVELAQEPVAIRRHDVERLRAQALAQSLGLDQDALAVTTLGCSGNGFEDVPDPRGLTATRLRGTFHVVAMPLSLRRAVVRACDQAGVEVRTFLYSLPASARACLTPVDGGRVLVIDVGGVQVDAGVFVEQRLTASTTVPWGGQVLSHAVASDGRLTSTQALAASLEGLASSNPSVRKMLEEQLPAVRDGLARLLEGQPKPDAAVIAGGGALIDGLAEWFERELGLPCRVGRSPRVAQQGELWHQLALGASVGALEMTAGPPASLTPRAPRGRFTRLLATAHSILNDYF